MDNPEAVTKFREAFTNLINNDFDFTNIKQSIQDVISGMGDLSGYSKEV